RISLLISLGILALSLMIKVADFQLVQSIQLKVFDTFQQIAPRVYTDVPVRIIDIDDESLSKIGQWPWPRHTLAQLVDQLHEAGAAAIALDIVFAEEDRTSPRHMLPLWGKQAMMNSALRSLPDHDQLLAEAIHRSNVVTGFVLTQTNTVA